MMGLSTPAIRQWLQLGESKNIGEVPTAELACDQDQRGAAQKA